MKKAFFIGYVWPEPSTTAAGHRMVQLLEAFQSFGYHITFGSTALKTEHSLDLDALGVKSVNIALNDSSFDAFIQKLKPDIVIFDRFMIEEQFGWRVAEFSPQALRVLNTEDLHALRKAREEVHKKKHLFSLDDWRNHPMTVREVASMYRSDISLMVSSYEMEILQNELGISENLLFHLPLLFDRLENSVTSKWPSHKARKDFVCIGNGKHAPNVDSIQVLKKEIWPLIRKQLPDAHLYVYGAYLPQQIEEMHHPKEGFHIVGWTKDIETVLKNARLLLAPLQFGAGIKGKLLDAMCCGTPSITTAIGTEGMHGDLPWCGSIVDDWDSFAKTAVELYLNPSKWEKAQKNGIVLINRFYEKEFLQQSLKQKIDDVITNLDTHRSQNFIGLMLQHHTQASTKYMAKWIEAKNRNQEIS
ncbi:glycosyltransferase family 4 protein [Muricauda sp. CAU 1633]|uniref:glycosyltransferase n=1 Tax=Allomuricauda sp. CAU 1633 TaxID=2816036 RepID=UPI001A8F5B7D|nr:glycosyltransferase [Muricauda sp. CAU 1633]MBO0323253.1 glycosyltransferase family 4 protein [Muricauda sp. CAU 1633]